MNISLEGAIPSQSLRESVKSQHQRRLDIVNPVIPVYKENDNTEGADYWLANAFGETPHPEVTAANETLWKVLTTAKEIAGQFLNKERDNGPSLEDQNYHAHGYRCVRILTDEIGIRDPMTLCVAYLHDGYQCITDPQQIENFEAAVRNQFCEDVGELSGCEFAERLLQKLRSFNQLDEKHSRLSRRVEEKFSTEIQKGIEEGFTPTSYEELKQKVIAEFVGDGDDSYFNLEALMEYCATGVFGNNNSEESIGENYPGCLEEFFVLIAQRVDNHRYPRIVIDRLNNPNTDLPLKMAKFRDAADVIYNLLPFSRAIEMQTGVSLLSEIGAATFFPEQWAAMQEALVQVSNGEKRKALSFRLSANMIAFRRYVSSVIEKAGLKKIVKEISAEDFEIKEIDYLEHIINEEPTQSILGDYDLAFQESIKSGGSLFSKWLGDTRQGKRGPTTPEFQKEQSEKFKNPQAWVEYFQGMTDFFRSRVVLGQKLSAEYPELEQNIRSSMVFAEDEETDDMEALVNYFVSNRTNVKRQRDEAISWRVEPELDEFGQMLLECHIILQLKPNAQPFEVHVESITQYIRNNYKDQMHLFYKLKELLSDGQDKKKIAKNFILNRLHSFSILHADRIKKVA